MKKYFPLLAATLLLGVVVFVRYGLRHNDHVYEASHSWVVSEPSGLSPLLDGFQRISQKLEDLGFKKKNLEDTSDRIRATFDGRFEGMADVRVQIECCKSIPPDDGRAKVPEFVVKASLPTMPSDPEVLKALQRLIQVLSDQVDSERRPNSALAIDERSTAP